MSKNEIQELSAKVFLMWAARELEGGGELRHDPELEDSFIFKVLTKKMEWAGVDIVIPDEFILLIEICTNGNPGISQLLLYDVLKKASEKNSGLPKGYVIKSSDFSSAFPMEFPNTVTNEKMTKLYSEKWDNQKFMNEYGHSANKVDTAEFWLDLMKK